MLLLMLLLVPNFGWFGLLDHCDHGCPARAVEVAADTDPPDDGEELGKATIERTWLGVRISPWDDTGAKVRKVFPGSPAHEAGIRSGDLIVAVDDVVTPSPRALQNLVAGYSPGSEVTVSIRRGCNTELTLEATLEEVTFVRSASGRELPLRWADER